MENNPVVIRDNVFIWAELRKARRISLRIFMPLDLQLKYNLEEKWRLNGELLRRRKSGSVTDKIFFSLVKLTLKRPFSIVLKIATPNLLDFLKINLGRAFSELDILELIYANAQQTDIKEMAKVLINLDPEFLRYLSSEF